VRSWRRLLLAGAIAVAAGAVLLLIAVLDSREKPREKANDDLTNQTAARLKTTPGFGAEGMGQLQIKGLRLTHYATVGGKEVRGGPIGLRLFETRVGDGVTLDVDLSQPGYCYVLAFNFDGQEQLLWPVDEKGKASDAVKPPRLKRLRYP